MMFKDALTQAGSNEKRVMDPVGGSFAGNGKNQP
jgi:hypothetical protein